jgi:broad specificity phosphatase PhoE
VATLVHLIRHGHHALLGTTLCGRMPGVRLDELGCRQMAEVAELIARSPPMAVQSSPQQRALQSASIIASACGRALEIVAAFDEINMGRWTGARFSDLAADPKWRRWNECRGTACPPRGESMAALQVRTVRHIEQLRGESDGIVIVSHAEPIRAALMHYLKIPLDLFHTVTIDPASISTIALDGVQGVVSRLNGKVTA